MLVRSEAPSMYNHPQAADPGFASAPVDGLSALSGACWVPALHYEVRLDVVEEAIVEILYPACEFGR